MLKSNPPNHRPLPDLNGHRTVAIETLGCKLNQADSDALARQFLSAGFRVSDNTTGEIDGLRRENGELKQLVAELSLEAAPSHFVNYYNHLTE